MENEPTLFELDNSYSLVKLKENCRNYVKEKLPSPVDGQDYDEYLKELKDETDLEFAYRLRKIADDIEKRILEPLKEEVRFLNENDRD